METLAAIHQRRSVGRLLAPGPNGEQLDLLLEAARRAPDHKRLQPWHFIVLEGQRKDEIAEVMARIVQEDDPEASDVRLESERSKLGRAPVAVAVATRRVETKLPFEELLSSTAAAIQNLLLAATDMGFGSIWRTGNSAYDPRMKRALGIDEADVISGFIYLGTIPPAVESTPS